MDRLIHRLQALISIPSSSREESGTADLIESEFSLAGIDSRRIGNNVVSKNKYWSPEIPVLLLNSHHDTVKPVSSYQRDPYTPTIDSGRLYGLGANDAGGALVCLIETFIHFYAARDLPFNILFIASAEEEISGSGGIELALKHSPAPWAGIVGEPTLMHAAVAERGLMVVDGKAKGASGHAARKEGKNALYIATDDIVKIRNIEFSLKSKYLPDTQAVVTQIQAGQQHNVIPDECHFVIDVRVNDRYQNKEVFHILDEATDSELQARSFRLNSSMLNEEHPLFQAIEILELKKYGSPTLSDQALMDFPTLKIGPGDSARSHTADEYIYLHELTEGYEGYIRLIETLKNIMT